MEGMFGCAAGVGIGFAAIILSAGLGEEVSFFVKLGIIRSVAMITFGAAMLEAYTHQIDNLVVPYVLYLALQHLELESFTHVHLFSSIF